MTRASGIPNRDSFLVRERLKKRGVNAIDQILDLIEELDDPAKKIWAWLEVAKFCYPKPTVPLHDDESRNLIDRADELLREFEAIQHEKKVIEVTAITVHNKGNE